MTRLALIAEAIRTYKGRRTKRGNMPYIRDLRRYSGIRDITMTERKRAMKLNAVKSTEAEVKIEWPTSWQDHQHRRTFDQPTEFIMLEDIDVPPYKARKDLADPKVNWIQARQIAEYLGMRSSESVLHSFESWRFDEFYRYFVPEADAVAIVAKLKS